ncbi:MAG TPA: hypothetical protein VJ867_14020 [Gemmatimonadaceae bacterium]|nr:hypothetical protein [Gemmatimonadaceae bacterium]
MSSSRRSFLGALGSLLGVGVVGHELRFRDAPAPTGAWDISWLDALTGKHKQIFTAPSLVTHLPLHVVVNYLDAFEEVYGLRFPDVNTVVGITQPLFPLNVNDATWSKYDVGRRWQIKDPKTGELATSNIFMENVPAGPGKVVGIKPLVARGTVFYQCNNALGGIARQLARELGKASDWQDIRADLIAGFLPRVKLVPAHTFMLGLCQERGFTYESI